MYWQLEVLTKQTWLCHGKMLSGEGVTGAFPASEVCPPLSRRCWGDRALGFFHYTHVMLLVWFIQYALAASGGFCGSNSAAQAEAQTLPGLHSKYNMHEEETSINNLFSPVKDDIVLRFLVLLHFVTWWCQLGAIQWAIPNTYTENKHGLHDMHIHRARIQVGSRRRLLLTLLSILHPDIGEQGGLPWTPA